MGEMRTRAGTDSDPAAGLVDFAYANGAEATQRLSREEQKRLGQFMTPPPVAEFMARRSLPTGPMHVIRVLDPAAGAGILAAAMVESLLRQTERPDRIEIILCEIDERLAPILRRLADRLRRSAKAAGVELTVAIRLGDFLMSSIALARKPVADVIIANPPYFKLNASDPRAIAHVHAVYGQPNIYGLFMAVCADLLAPGGRWCFITPRSWTNGLYFAAVRRHLIRALSVDAMHLFESRREHFTDDEVLQEAMITWASAQARSCTEIVVSSSAGSRDLGSVALQRLPVARIIGDDEARMIALPTTGVQSPWEGWSATLGSYGLKVSTGPVVAFRAAEHLRETKAPRAVPILWMQHIHHMQIRWPIRKKREHILANGETAWMLVPNANLVVMRRFSPKEDPRRITAAPYLAGSLPGAVLGLENHTNYISRPGGALSDEETRGLAALLNSRVVDDYLRTVAGNTQVNATDLRKLPLPPLEQIVAIGRLLRAKATLEMADVAVDTVLGDASRIAATA